MKAMRHMRPTLRTTPVVTELTVIVRGADYMSWLFFGLSTERYFEPSIGFINLLTRSSPKGSLSIH
jgi:hypothetical protein